MMSGVSKHTSCRQIFKNYDISLLTMILYVYLKWYVTLKGTKIQWSKMYTFITIIYKKIVSTC